MLTFFSDKKAIPPLINFLKHGVTVYVQRYLENVNKAQQGNQTETFW